MKQRVRRWLTLATGLPLLAALLASVPVVTVSAEDSIAKRAASGQLQQPVIKTAKGDRKLPTLSPAVVGAAKFALEADARDLAGDMGAPSTTPSGTPPDSVTTGSDATNASDEGNQQSRNNLGIAARSLGCSQRLGRGGSSDTDNGNSQGSQNAAGDGGKRNVRVNQDCTYRRQAEELIKYNPLQPSNLIAGQNDSRVGFNHCGFDYSFDNGRLWGDGVPPFFQKVNNPAGQQPIAGDPNRHTIVGGPGTRHTYDACSDPALAFDSKGRAFYGGVVFDVNTDASALLVTASPPGAGGSFYYNIATSSRAYVVAEDNSPTVFHDKEFIAADRYPGSPNLDNVYVTWTVFKFSPKCGPQPSARATYCSSPIFGSMSTDHGIHWSTPEEISGTSSALCFLGNQFDPTRPASACDFDQGSEPIALPNGDLQVIFNNGNTDIQNPNSQQLGVHCRPSGDSRTGSAHLNCLAPSKVGDDVTVGEPNCNFGRGPEECIPGAYIRTNDFPRINAENSQNSHLYATWQDYRNGEFDIQLSQSLDGGLTWREVGTVNPDRGLDHYMPDVDITPSSAERDRVGAGYYRTERVPGESNPSLVFTPVCGSTDPPEACAGVQKKNSDYVLAGGTGAQTPYDFVVVSPSFPPPDGIQLGFNGDYSGIVINRDENAHPIWSDTRNADPFAPTNGVTFDEDVFTDSLQLPNGRGEEGEGRIGER